MNDEPLNENHQFLMEIYYIGENAYKDGLSIRDNPYNIDYQLEMHRMWASGYMTAAWSDQ